MTFLSEERPASLNQPCLKRVAHGLVPRESSGKPFLFSDHESLMQRVHHVDGRRMMVLPRGTLPHVVRQQRGIQIPALTRLGARTNSLDRPGRERQRRQARRYPEALLGARVTHVDMVRVHVYRHSPERGHCIHQEERLCPGQVSADLGQGLRYTR